MFNTNFKILADYDLYLRLILNKKIFGGATKRNDLIGTVSSGVDIRANTFLRHLLEETKIRINTIKI